MKRNKLFFYLLVVFFVTSRNLSFCQYFQQEVNYKITVGLNDKKHSLSAFESIEYVNNSTQILTEIYFHLWPQAYKSKKSALARQDLQNGSSKIYFTPEKERGFIDSLDFKVDGKKVKCIVDSINHDICKLVLNEPLFSNSKIIITTPFFIKIPSATLSRMGHIGQSYAISQWYPKPAVFDHLGWHIMPYLNQGEFYSEFGSFEVSITLPKNYVVGATGDLQEEEEIKWLENKVAETNSISEFNKNMDFPPSEKETKTITFKQNRVHDFAWFADKRFHVLKGSLELPYSHEKVNSWVMFTNSEPLLWKKSIGFINDALYYYSLWNGDYAYKNFTAVDGTIAAGGGMEYPNITIIGESGSLLNHEITTIHEVGHCWFYGMLGSNERDHAWMDEGITTSNDNRYLMLKYNNDSVRYKSIIGNLGVISKITGLDDLNTNDFAYLEYLYVARKKTEQPIETVSDKFTETNYGAIVYTKTALGFNYLRSYLGDEVYDACMKDYFNQWKFKHPYPEDLRNIFLKRTDKNLDWFFDDFLKTTKYADYSICKLQRIYGDSFIRPGSKSYAVLISNKGEWTPPFTVSALKKGRIVNTKWHEGFLKNDTVFIICDDCDEITIDAFHDLPDHNRKNNNFRTVGIFKSIEKISLPFMLRNENPNRTQISWLPVFALNNYNKAMVGLALHNLSFVDKKFEFAIAPLYSFGNKSLVGSGRISYTIYPKAGDFHFINLTLGTNRFSYLIDEYRTVERKMTSTHLNYQQLNGAANFKFRKNNPLSNWNNKVSFRTLHLWKETVKYNPLPDSGYGGTIVNEYQNHNQLIFTFDNNRTLDPYRFNLTLEQDKNYFRYAVEFNYRFSYKQKNKGLDFRLFFGSYLTNLNSTNNFHLTGTGNTRTGSEDYLFDNRYFGRSETEGVLSKQFYEQEGGFKVYSPIGRSNKWIASLNIKSHLPGKLPVRIFADIGIYDGSNKAYEEYKGLTFDAGIEVYLIQNLIEVYIPLLVSKDIDKFYKENELKFTERIRFVFNINALSPFRLRESFFSY